MLGFVCRGLTNPEQEKVKMKVTNSKVQRTRHVAKAHGKLGSTSTAWRNTIIEKTITHLIATRVCKHHSERVSPRKKMENII
jgi:hypothetical protein